MLTVIMLLAVGTCATSRVLRKNEDYVSDALAAAANVVIEVEVKKPNPSIVVESPTTVEEEEFELV